MNNYKQHCTKGQVYIASNNDMVYAPKETGGIVVIADMNKDQDNPPRRERVENTRLIAEAFNVLHETGMTPRELADTLSYLEGKLGSLCDTMPDQDWADTDATAVDSDLNRCRHIIDDMQAKLEEHQPVTPA